ERGKYLFESVADCGGCHNPRNPEKFASMSPPERTGSGWSFPKELGFPGAVHAPNITTDKETGIGTWTDGEKIRAIREGISKDGRALFPFMRFQAFAKLSDEDLYSLVAYLNTLPPVKNRMPRTELDFPVKYLIKFAAQPVTAKVSAPERSDKTKYGEYLVTVAGCIECHTQLDKGELVKGMEYAGGHEFPIGNYLVRSANITPDEETGLGKWSEERFVSKFKGHVNLTYENAPRTTQANFTVMPWYSFAQMTEDDLKAIYAYLRTIPAVRNPVDMHPAQAPPQS
ncbi:MAG: cytochrome c, partial [Acidobacteria bacterium]|nr:cytochrome c [Acidobacteriota bacterium]